MRVLPLAWRPLDEAGAREMLTWRYPPPYDVYDMPPHADGAEALVRSLTRAASAYYRADDGQGRMVAFCCFGAEAQVPGGDYAAEALDIGMGMRPDLTGRGHGRAIAQSTLGLARMLYGEGARRVTIAARNVRARKIWTSLGFTPVSAFRRPGGAQYVVYLGPGGAADTGETLA